MAFTPDMPIHQRIAIISEALTVVLNRDICMAVETSVETGPGLYVSDGQYDGVRVRYSIEQIARELEVLLS